MCQKSHLAQIHKSSTSCRLLVKQINFRLAVIIYKVLFKIYHPLLTNHSTQWLRRDRVHEITSQINWMPPTYLCTPLPQARNEANGVGVGLSYRSDIGNQFYRHIMRGFARHATWRQNIIKRAYESALAPLFAKSFLERDPKQWFFWWRYLRWRYYGWCLSGL